MVVEMVSSFTDNFEGRYLDFTIQEALMVPRMLVIAAVAVPVQVMQTNFVVAVFTIAARSHSRIPIAAGITTTTNIAIGALLKTTQHISVLDQTECSEYTQAITRCTIGSAFMAIRASPVKLVH